MASLQQIDDTPTRGRCYDCFRPVATCFCGAIPTIENQTEILILQHSRERFHPFNTARIVRKALAKSSVVVGFTPQLAETVLPIRQQAGVLYPCDEATSLAELSDVERPAQLIVIDGTWHQAKTVMRDVPILRTLPKFKLAPTTPGQYRIRREPTLQSLSTLEATVAALRELEPNLSGLDQLSRAFNTMVTGQLDHPNLKQAWRRHEKNRGRLLNIPRSLVDDFHNIVVAYGESAPGKLGVKRDRPQPVYWVARRLSTGESFQAQVKPETHLSDQFLSHLRLPRSAFDHSLSNDEFCSAWRNFLKPHDRLAVFHDRTLRLLTNVGAKRIPTTILKGIQIAGMQKYPTLDCLIEGEKIPVVEDSEDRATQRLNYAIAYVVHLHALATAAPANTAALADGKQE